MAKLLGQVQDSIVEAQARLDLARARAKALAMAVTGHRTRSMFDRYNITSTDDVRKAMERVSA